jgi:hypothetical protein
VRLTVGIELVNCKCWEIWDLLDCGVFWFARNLSGKAKSYCTLLGNEFVGKVKIKLNILRDSMVS